MATPEPTEVAPWYLRNINQALALDETTGNVYIRTGFEGNIIISGNVNIPGNVDAHISEIGTSGTLTVPYMPIAGNITIDPGQSVSVTGNVNIGTMPEVEIKNDTGNPIPISANTSVNSSVNPIYVTGNVTTAGGSNQGKLWYFQIAEGTVAGTSSIFKAGYNPSIQNNTEESLWGGSVIYPWSAWTTTGTLSCVSTSASDTGSLHITGLRASDWVQIEEDVTLNGLTPVVTSNSFARINNVHYFSANTNDGNINVNRNGTTGGDIEAGLGQGQMAQYTVPAGYTAYLLSGTSNMGKGNDGTGKFKYRLYGSNFQTAMVFLLYQSTFSFDFPVPLVLPEKTDLDVTMLASVAGTACTCAYELVLIAN